MLDNERDIERLEEIVAPGERQPVQMRIAPGVSPDTHPSISTGGPNTKFGFNLDAAAPAIERVMASDKLDLEGLHIHIGSQIVDLAPFRPAIAALADLGDFRMFNLGGGLGVAYTEFDHPPSIEEYVAFKVDAVEQIAGPGEADPRRAGPRARRELDRHALHRRVGQAQRHDLRRGRRRHVRQPAPDALRRALRGPGRRAARAAGPAATSSASTASPATC